jgi:hypothetical protein
VPTKNGEPDAVIEIPPLFATSAKQLQSRPLPTRQIKGGQTVYLDHPRQMAEWELYDTPAPVETTENYWRFRFALPALLFFCCMMAYYPQIGAQALPSDFMLQRLNLPVFHVLFQVMIFLALLESGTGSVHAFNERVAHAYTTRTGRELTKLARLSITSAVLLGSIFLAAKFGLVTLIARGYRLLSYVVLAIFVLPVLTIGAWRLWLGHVLLSLGQP